MFMRFRAQYFNKSTNKWANVKGKNLSKWVYAGPARFKTRQVGWIFSFDQPAAGTKYVLRGFVYFDWRRRNSDGKWVTVRHRRAATEGGHPNTRNADPKSYSHRRCVLS
jgi:hypothetical protein